MSQAQEFVKSQCPLCGSTDFQVVSHQAWVRKSAESHLLCLTCDLIFLRPDLRLTPDQEKARYDFHENDTGDTGYINFLRPVVKLCAELYSLGERPQVKVLDFGCGPHPALAKLLEQVGFQVALYDVFYRPDESTFMQSYDLVVSTEVFEHLFRPEFEIERLRRLLAGEDATLLIMTQLHQGAEHFQKWGYGSDPSHVVFYSRKTLNWIQNRFHFPRFWVVSGKTAFQV